MNRIKKAFSVLCTATMILAVGCEEKETSSVTKVNYFGGENQYTQAAEAYENVNGEVVEQDRIAEFITTTPVSKGNASELQGMNIKFNEIYSTGVIKASDMGGEFNYDREVLAIACDITNNTGEACDVNAFDFVVKFLDGDETEIYTGMEAMLSAQEKITDIESFNSTVEAGETLTGYAAFGIYSEWETVTILYNPAGDDNNEAISFEITRDMVKTLG